MFGKFITNEDCMKVLEWLCNHPDREYSAAIIGVESGISDIGRFMAVLSILDGVGFIEVLDGMGNEELILRVDKEASISKLLFHLKDEFNDIAFRSETVSPALAYLTSEEARNIVDSELMNSLEPDDILDICKNYKDLDLSDPKNKELYDLCLQLDEDGELDEFIAHLEGLKEK